MASPTIISLAVLKVNWDELKRDYVENFVPLVAEAVRVSGEDVVSLPTLQAQIEAQFGLTLPQNLIETILRRARKRGYVRIDHGVYHPNAPRLAELGFQEVQIRVLRMHETLIRRLREFANERHGLDWHEEETESALLAYLADHQLAIVSAATRGGPLPTMAESRRGARFVVGEFARHLQDSHSGDFDYLETIVKGNMLANAIFLPDPHQTARNFRNTSVYFDTTFLIYALGYAGETRQAPCTELLELLYETGGDLRCFRHTLEEMRGALDATASLLSLGRARQTRGPAVPSVEYFMSRGYTESDIHLFVGKLERDLGSLRVRVVDKPEYIPAYTIDEAGFHDLLDERINYTNPRAVERDVDSVSAILRQRRGQDYFFVEDCRAVFVTTNTRLAFAAAEFFYREAGSTAVSPCLTDYTLTNLLWLKKPTSAPDLPRKRIIADCFAATQPGDELWVRYLEEMDRLEQQGEISTDDYYYLRHSLEAKSALMNLTLGEPEAFTRGTVPEILELVQSRMRADLESRLGRLEAGNAERRSRIEVFSTRVASWMGRIVRILTILLLLIGEGTTLFQSVLSSSATPVGYALWVLWTVLVVLSVGSLVRGTTLETYFRRIEVALARSIEQTLIGFFG